MVSAIIPMTVEQLFHKKNYSKRLHYMTEVVFPAVEEKSKDTERKRIKRPYTVVPHDFGDTETYDA